jgi:hypothetical protein
MKPMTTELEKSVFSYLSKKTVLLRQYLSVTGEFLDALKQKRRDGPETFVLRRQSLIQEIDALDRFFQAGVDRASPGPSDLSGAAREAVRAAWDSLRRILAEAGSRENALRFAVQEEGESLRGELLKLRAARTAAHGYGRLHEPGPRFLDTRK